VTFAVLLLGWSVAVTPARASMTLSKVIVDFAPSQPSRDDIEITNRGDEVLYVSVEPFEVLDPGQPGERRVTNPDPRVLGLLVSPNRLALGPGERKIVRFSLLERPVDADRIYRVAIQPVVGELTAQRSALKVVVGYDVLVIARPLDGRPVLSISREGVDLEIRNLGNTNALLFDGRQCDEDNETDCVDLPTKRIYPGSSWQVRLPGEGPARYLVSSGSGTTTERY
jgi:P pilus assembly chaperone PapD